MKNKPLYPYNKELSYSSYLFLCNHNDSSYYLTFIGDAIVVIDRIDKLHKSELANFWKIKDASNFDIYSFATQDYRDNKRGYDTAHQIARKYLLLI